MKISASFDATTGFKLDKDVLKECRRLKISISDVCREALAKALKRATPMEQGVARRKGAQNEQRRKATRNSQ